MVNIEFTDDKYKTMTKPPNGFQSSDDFLLSPMLMIYLVALTVWKYMSMFYSHL